MIPLKAKISHTRMWLTTTVPGVCGETAVRPPGKQGLARKVLVRPDSYQRDPRTVVRAFISYEEAKS